jgi:hypothetical protein
MIKRLEDAELAVSNIFTEEFPKESFEKWNSLVSDDFGENIIRNVGRASMINIKRFIQDLWE